MYRGECDHRNTGGPGRCRRAGYGGGENRAEDKLGTFGNRSLRSGSAALQGSGSILDQKLNIRIWEILQGEGSSIAESGCNRCGAALAGHRQQKRNANGARADGFSGYLRLPVGWI